MGAVGHIGVAAHKRGSGCGCTGGHGVNSLPGALRIGAGTSAGRLGGAGKHSASANVAILLTGVGKAASGRHKGALRGVALGVKRGGVAGRRIGLHGNGACNLRSNGGKAGNSRGLRGGGFGLGGGFGHGVVPIKGCTAFGGG